MNKLFAYLLLHLAENFEADFMKTAKKICKNNKTMILATINNTSESKDDMLAFIAQYRDQLSATNVLINEIESAVIEMKS